MEDEESFNEQVQYNLTQIRNDGHSYIEIRKNALNSAAYFAKWEHEASLWREVAAICDSIIRGATCEDDNQ